VFLRYQDWRRVERDLGNIFTQTFPGQGVLFHVVGLISFLGQDVLTIHGPHDISTRVTRPTATA
jgi:hypothetical protein